MHSGPVVIGFDGTTIAEQALRQSAALLAPRPAVVVVVWEAGRAFALEALSVDAVKAVELAPVSPDLRSAEEVQRAAYDATDRLAQQGAALATQLGYHAEGLAVADERTVAETLLRVAAERDSQALVVGSHGRRGLTAALLGSTSKVIVAEATCPVMIVRGVVPHQDSGA